MAKGTAKNGKGRRRPQSSAAAFVLGRAAFKKISAVEGIFVSKRLAVDLDELSEATGTRRRAVLAAKYGRR